MKSPNKKRLSWLRHEDVETNDSLQVSNENTKTLFVGWDTEFDTSKEYIPISTQFYVLNDSTSHFIEHIGRKLTPSEVINYLHTHYPEYSDITLVTHFGKAEIMGLDGGREMVFENDFLALHKTFIGYFRVNINGTTINIELVGTYLLLTEGLEKIGEMVGIKKLETGGYRETDRMLEWYKNDPTEFRDYAIRDAEICVKYYDRLCKELKNIGLISGKMRKTVGAIGDHALFKITLRSNYENFGYSKKPVYINGRMKGYKFEIPAHLRRFEDCYHGGRNETFLYGFHEGNVWNFDLRSACPTILSVLPEWDLSKPFTTTNPKELHKFMKANPLAVGYVNIDFKFKKSRVSFVACKA